MNDVTAFAQWRGPAIQNVETINRQYRFQAPLGPVPHHDGVSPAFFAHDEPPISDDEAGKKAAAFIAQLDGDQSGRRIR